MTTINLRDFYPWYENDEFIEVTDEVAAELIANKRYEKACERRKYYHQAQYSLDVEDGIENSSLALHNNSPEQIIDMKERHCQLCRALNSLPEIQGRRIEAHYFLGQSQREIAENEGVSVNAVSKSIQKGLLSMKKFLKKLR
ncbi:MAG: sigma-70 family RNA polymerase sigma factor [Clostridiales bacterium]|nr:sigma-70 family RNA polymerase sigma factor [Clostridiales bacterium]